jgi:ankyrin repeat protein
MVNALEAAAMGLRGARDNLSTEMTASTETVRFLISIGAAIERYGAEAMIAAVIPTGPDVHNEYRHFTPYEDHRFTPNTGICELLQLEGVPLDIRLEGVNLLQLAIRRWCNLETAKFLIDIGMQVHSESHPEDGMTTLHDVLLGCSKDRYSLVKLLLEHSVDLKACSCGLTILESSLMVDQEISESESEYLQIFEMLFESGAPVKSVSNRPNPFFHSFQHHWDSILTRLIELNADTLLIHRVIDAGADIHTHWGGNRSSTPLQKAVRKGRLDLAQELMDRGADVNALPSPMFGMTVLQAACSPYYTTEIPEWFIKHLIDSGADVNAPAAEDVGVTALQAAAFRGFLNVACLLLDHGADVNAVGRCLDIELEDHWSCHAVRALDIAAYYGRLDMVQLLRDAGGRSAKPGTSGFEGAIDIAKITNNYAVVKLLEAQ